MWLTQNSGLKDCLNLIKGIQISTNYSRILNLDFSKEVLQTCRCTTKR